jgi:hypothetical protein
MDYKKYIGMDVHQASISIAVRDATGKVVAESVIETKAGTILAFIRGARPRCSQSVPNRNCQAQFRAVR